MNNAEEPFQLDVTDVLDLHAFAPRDILAVVEAYLEEARLKGFSTVRIIHCKGTGTQRARVQGLLSRTPWVIAFEDAPLEAGSWGATVVWFDPAWKPATDGTERTDHQIPQNSTPRQRKSR